MTVTEPQPVEVGGNPTERIYEGVDQLAAALAAVQAELPRVLAVEEADAGSYSYKYATLATVSEAILPLLGRNGLAFTGWPTVTDQGKFVLRYQLLHKSGQSMTGEYPIAGGNAQAVGSSITYARRYALSAVTGIAPDQDDDAAAAVGAREVQTDEQNAERDRERQLALDSIRGAWFNQYGEYNPTAAADVFKTWSHGGSPAEANPQQLRAFAAYLNTLPVQDAGSEPPTAEASRYRDPDAPLSVDQRTRIIASLTELGIRERQDRLQWMTSTLGRTVASTNDLTMAEAGQLIETLNGGVTVVEGGAQ